MVKQLVYWKPIRGQNIYGESYLCDSFPKLIDISHGGELLSKIVSMPSKTPISFESAANLAQIEFDRASDAGQIGRNLGQCHWFYENFVQWISDQGFHIELTGDEFETPLICSLVA